MFPTTDEVRRLPSHRQEVHPGFILDWWIPTYPHHNGSTPTLETTYVLDFLITEVPSDPRQGFLVDGGFTDGDIQVIHGGLKWDWCVNIQRDPGQMYLDHYCDEPEMAETFRADIAQAVYALGPQMEKWMD